MGKTKRNSTSKEVSNAFLEMSPTSSRAHENLTKDALRTDLVSSPRLQMLTGSSEKAKKKRKKGEKEVSTLQAEQHQETRRLKNREKLQDENITPNPQMEEADGSLGEMSPYEASPRKKRKKLEQTEENVTDYEVFVRDALGSSRKKKKKSSRERRSIDPHESKTNGESEERVRTKKNNVKHKNLTTQDTHTVPNREIKSDGDEDYKELTSPAIQMGTGVKKKKNIKSDVREIDSHLLEELKEFVPKVGSREPVDVHKMINYDLPRYKEFKKKGIPLNHGKFSASENDTLRKNVEDFMALTGIDSATKLFFTHRFKEEQENIKRLKKLHRFFEKIADGIPRSCHDIYGRGRRMFDGSNHMGKFSKEEIHSMCKLHTMYGNNWKKISELTGRSAGSLEKRYSQLTVNEGVWSVKEVQRLLRAVRDHIVNWLQLGPTSVHSTRIDREMFYKKIPWRKIAAKVKTRSWTKCREKWMSVLAVKMSSGAVTIGNKSGEVKVKLIKAMYEMQVDDVAYVNWDDLTTVIGDVPPSYVQRKWHKLKVCHVPHWQTKCFADIIDFLYENVLPRLETELEERGGETQQQEQQETFLLSEIFQDINEEDDDDDDKETDDIIMVA